jgi:hypothetical protein
MPQSDRSRWYESVGFLVAFLGLLVSVTAFWLPYKMDLEARDRDNARVCIEAVVDLRAALTALETGYATAPGRQPDRLADWNAGKAAIERTRVSCENASLTSAVDSDDAAAMWQQYDTAQNAARTKTPALEVLTAIRDWTTDVISELTR